MAKNMEISRIWMLKEIREQLNISQKILDLRLKGANQETSFSELDGFGPRWAGVERFAFWGLGSSYNAALWGNYIFEELAGRPCEAEAADEVIGRQNVIEANTAVVALSQSGESADLLQAAKEAKEKGAFVLALTNHKESSLGKLADITIDTLAGNERAIAATKTFTAQLLNLLLLAMHLGGRGGSELARGLGRLPGKIELILDNRRALQPAIETLKDFKRLTVLGRKYNYPIALEGAQKIKEAAYIQAEAMPAEEFRHGPKAIVDRGYPIIFLAPHGPGLERNLDEIKEIAELGGQVLAVSDSDDEELERAARWTIKLPEAPAALNSILNTVVLQLLALGLGQERGIDVDQPRHLKKFISR